MDKQKLKHVCKFCKKRFVCGRSLGGHIRCHLPKKTLRVSTDLSDVLLKSSAMSSSSETEPGKVSLSKMNQGHGKSKRSSLVGNNSHSSISEVIEDEQQEVDVAMCLIMLSRDVGPWGRGKTTNGNRGENKRKRGKKVSTAEKLVSVDSEDQQKGLKMKSVEVLESGFLSNDHSLELSEDKRRKREKVQGKKDVFTAVNAEKLVSDASEHLQKGVGVSENEFLSNDQSFDLSDNVRKCVEMEEFGKSLSKRSTFECTTCNKVFYSHQALGGHKASHKKLLDAPETNEEFNPQHKDDVFTEIGLGSSPTLSKKAVQKHECPICFRVFPSGQALGGHKRSHLVANNNEEKIDQTCQTAVDDVIEGSSTSKPREMLNLNLNLTPDQQVQEEGDTAVTTASSSNSLIRVIKPFWWVENPHKREGFLSLISN